MLNQFKQTFMLIIVSTFTLAGCANTQSQKTEINAKHDNITVMGRTVTTEQGSVMFSYPGVTFSMNVKAKALTAKLSSSQGNNYIDITIDGGQPRAVKVSQQVEEITLFSSPEEVQHQVVIQHRSESWHGTTTLHSFTLTDGELLTAPVLPKKKILFIGDSITCGDAIDRDIPLSKGQCNKSNAWWNAKQTFGMLLSDKLNTQAQLVCYGGKGVVRTWQGKTDELNAEDFYKLAIPAYQYKNELTSQTNKYRWQQENYQADLAVIVLGTNDFSSAAGPFPEQAYFVNRYRRLIDQIRTEHPDIKLALSDGPMLSGTAKQTLRHYLADIVSHYNNDDVILLLADHNPGDSCDYHPNRDKHQLIADQFYQPLKKLMNW